MVRSPRHTPQDGRRVNENTSTSLKSRKEALKSQSPSLAMSPKGFSRRGSGRALSVQAPAEAADSAAGVRQTAGHTDKSEATKGCTPHRAFCTSLSFLCCLQPHRSLPSILHKLNCLRKLTRRKDPRPNSPTVKGLPPLNAELESPPVHTPRPPPPGTAQCLPQQTVGDNRAAGEYF